MMATTIINSTKLVESVAKGGELCRRRSLAGPVLKSDPLIPLASDRRPEAWR